MGNNHRLDYFEKGSADTVETLKRAGISYAYGGYTGTYEAQGILIGFVSVNGLGKGAGVEKALQEGIDSLREEGCQIVLACCHGEWNGNTIRKIIRKRWENSALTGGGSGHRASSPCIAGN